MRLKWLAVIGLVAVPMLARAECGWLLMMPPDRGSDVPAADRPVFDAPVSVWVQHSAYDPAEACERGKAAAIDRMLQYAKLGLVSPADAAVPASARCLPASQVPVR
jgi:hypothetical protein